MASQRWARRIMEMEGSMSSCVIFHHKNLIKFYQTFVEKFGRQKSCWLCLSRIVGRVFGLSLGDKFVLDIDLPFFLDPWGRWIPFPNKACTKHFPEKTLVIFHFCFWNKGFLSTYFLSSLHGWSSSWHVLALKWCIAFFHLLYKRIFIIHWKKLAPPLIKINAEITSNFPMFGPFFWISTVWHYHWVTLNPPGQITTDWSAGFDSAQCLQFSGDKFVLDIVIVVFFFGGSLGTTNSFS